jgi:hypothetical protein
MERKNLNGYFKSQSEIPRYKNIEAWYCPDCGAEGDAETLDFIVSGSVWTEDEHSRVTYCCSECYETNIYLKIED